MPCLCHRLYVRFSTTRYRVTVYQGDGCNECVDVSAQKTKSALVTEEITEINAFSTSAKVTVQCFETSSRNLLSTGMLTTAYSQLGRSGHS